MGEDPHSIHQEEHECNDKEKEEVMESNYERKRKKRKEADS